MTGIRGEFAFEHAVEEKYGGAHKEPDIDPDACDHVGNHHAQYEPYG